MKTLNRRTFIKSAAGGALAASTMGCDLFKGNKPGDAPLNLLYIMTDQQPTGTLGCYGNPLDPSPHLDRLARTGIRFEGNYIGGFPCSPSRGSLFTGLYPQGHGVYQNNVKLAENIPTLGSIMKAAGRDTAYFGKSHLEGATYRDVPGGEAVARDGQSYYDSFNNGHWYLKPVLEDQGLRFEKVEGGKGEDYPQLGFDTWAGGWKDYRAYLREAGLGELIEKNPMVGNHYDIPSTTEDKHQYSLIPEEHHMEAFFTNKALDFLASRKDNPRPFCLALSYFGPHLPVAPPRPWDEKYSLDQIELPPNHRDLLEGKPAGLKNNRRCYVLPEWSEEQFKDYSRRYYGYSAYIDHQIGRVLSALRQHGLEDNTIVIFTSDHGDMVAAHGCIFKIGTGYEELANTPFIMRVPGLKTAGTVDGSLISTVDMLPTVMDLLGLPADPRMHGRSYKGILESSAPFRDRVFSHWGTRSFLTCDGEWKYQLHWRGDMDELYNLHDDPGEMTNLIADAACREIRGRNREAVLEWLHDTGHPHAGLIAKDSV